MRTTINPEAAGSAQGRCGVTFGAQSTMIWFYAVYGDQSAFVGMPYETARWRPALGAGHHRRHVVLAPVNVG